MNPNVNRHWAVKAKARKKQKNDAFWLTKLAGTPPISDKYYLGITFHPPINRGRDIDNCLSAIKGALDGIALAWGVNDKDFRYTNPDFGDVVKGGKVVIEITEK